MTYFSSFVGVAQLQHKKTAPQTQKFPGIKTIEPRTELTQRNPQYYLQTQEHPPPVSMKRLQILLLRRGRSLTSELSTSQVIITFCITTWFIWPLFVWVRYVQMRTLWLFCISFSVCVFFFASFYHKQQLTVHSGAFKEQTPGGKVRSEVRATAFSGERNSHKCAKRNIQQSCADVANVWIVLKVQQCAGVS